MHWNSTSLDLSSFNCGRRRPLSFDRIFLLLVSSVVCPFQSLAIFLFLLFPCLIILALPNSLTLAPSLLIPRCTATALFSLVCVCVRARCVCVFVCQQAEKTCIYEFNNAHPRGSFNICSHYSTVTAPTRMSDVNEQTTEQTSHSCVYSCAGVPRARVREREG